MFKGQGPSTASQTAWAVMGLCALDDPHLPSLKRGIDYLIRTQNTDGSWSEQEITAVRSWSASEIDAALGQGLFTPNFEEEWAMYCALRRRYLTERSSGPGLCAGDSFPDLFKEIGLVVPSSGLRPPSP